MFDSSEYSVYDLPMGHSWLKGRFMPKYVTEEHLDQRLNIFEERLGQKFVTKDEFNGRMDDMMNTMDGMTKILRRLDQERVFTIERIKRIESDVTMIKTQLHLA